MRSRKNLHGIPSTPPAVSASGPEQAVRWRRLQLTAAGFDDLTAHRLARDPDVDLHAVLSLGEARCRQLACGPGDAATDAVDTDE